MNEQAHHPNCYQNTGVPADMPADICDCQVLRVLDLAYKADAAERRAEEAEYHVEQLRDARDRAERRIEQIEALADEWQEDYPSDLAACSRTADQWWRDLHATLNVEGVGTGAGEGVTGQDAGTTWVTRSADCPEAPAQAHPLAPSYATEAVLQSAVLALADDWDDFEHDQITCPKYDCSDCTMKNAVYDLRTCVRSVAALTSEPERGADGGVS